MPPKCEKHNVYLKKIPGRLFIVCPECEKERIFKAREKLNYRPKATDSTE